MDPETLITSFRDCALNSEDLGPEFNTLCSKDQHQWPTFTVYLHRVKKYTSSSLIYFDFITLDKPHGKGWAKNKLRMRNSVQSLSDDSMYLTERNHETQNIEYYLFEKSGSYEYVRGKKLSEKITICKGMRMFLPLGGETGTREITNLSEILKVPLESLKEPKERQIELNLVANISINIKSVKNKDELWDTNPLKICEFHEVKPVKDFPCCMIHLPPSKVGKVQTSTGKSTFLKTLDSAVVPVKTLQKIGDSNGFLVNGQFLRNIPSLNMDCFQSQFPSGDVFKFLMQCGFIYALTIGNYFTLKMAWHLFFGKMLTSSEEIPGHLLEHVREQMEACVGFKLSEDHWLIMDTQVKIFKPPRVQEDSYMVNSLSMEAGHLVVLFHKGIPVDLCGFPTSKLVQKAEDKPGNDVAAKFQLLKRKREFSVDEEDTRI